MRRIAFSFTWVVLVLCLPVMGQDKSDKVDETHPDFAVPINEERRNELGQELATWLKETYRDVYLKHPLTDAEQDKKILKAYSAYIDYQLNPNPINRNIRDIVLNIMRDGINFKGSELSEPVMVWLQARERYRSMTEGPPIRWDIQATKRHCDLLEPMVKREVPAIIRAKLCADIVAGCTADVQVSRKRVTKAIQEQAQEYFKKYVQFMVESVKGGHHRNQIEALESWAMIMESVGPLELDTSEWIADLDKALEPVTEVKAFREAMNGVYHLRHAWIIRGRDVAGSVDEQGWKGFASQLAKAATRLEHAYSIADQEKKYELSGKIATYMVTTGMGLQYDRKKESEWFRRAMVAEGGTLRPFQCYLLYLEPKWHGSIPEMVALGRSALAKKDWQTQISRNIIFIHGQIGNMVGNKQQYLSQPEVADDIETYFVNALKVYPNNRKLRTEFLLSACLAGNAEWGKTQFEALKGDLDPTVISPRDEANMLKRVGLEPKVRTNETPQKK